MGSRSSREEILTEAIQLFAAAGYTGVSMRNIARACHLNVGSLYHYFSDKQQLHLAAMQQAFSGKSDQLLSVLNGSEPAIDRLTNLIDMLCQILSDDQTFSRLVQRELLDGDEIRLKQLAEQIFAELSIALQRLCRQLNPQLDPVLLSSSIFGIILYLFQAAPLRKQLPGFQLEHEQPEIIGQHIKQLLCYGLVASSPSRGST